MYCIFSLPLDHNLRSAMNIRDALVFSSAVVSDIGNDNFSGNHHIFGEIEQESSKSVRKRGLNIVLGTLKLLDLVCCGSTFTTNVTKHMYGTQDIIVRLWCCTMFIWDFRWTGNDGQSPRSNNIFTQYCILFFCQRW